MEARGEVSWAALPVAEQEEMDGVVAMLTEAAAQGHADAQAVLGDIYTFGQGAAPNDARALELYRQATLQGNASAHYNLGCLLKNVRKDFDGAEAAYRAAIAADPGHAKAHHNLGVLLRMERKDIDGAEAAYRAAIAADPGHANAHINLATLLRDLAAAIEDSGGDLAAAAALYRECLQVCRLAKGAEA